MLHQRGRRRFDVPGVFGERGRHRGSDPVRGVGDLHAAAGRHHPHTTGCPPRPPGRRRPPGCRPWLGRFLRGHGDGSGPGAPGRVQVLGEALDLMPGRLPAQRTAARRPARRRRRPPPRSARPAPARRPWSHRRPRCRRWRRSVWCGHPGGSTRTSPVPHHSGPGRTASRRPSTDSRPGPARAEDVTGAGPRAAVAGRPRHRNQRAGSWRWDPVPLRDGPGGWSRCDRERAELPVAPPVPGGRGTGLCRAVSYGGAG